MSELKQKLAELRVQYDQLNNAYTASIQLLTDARFASGDNGARMQPEFIEYLHDLKGKASQRDAMA